jgi:hypothetical protein
MVYFFYWSEIKKETKCFLKFTLIFNKKHIKDPINLIILYSLLKNTPIKGPPLPKLDQTPNTTLDESDIIKLMQE